MTPEPPLPTVLAGPVLRRLEDRRVCLWLAVSNSLRWQFRLYLPDGNIVEPDHDESRQIQAGQHLWYLLLDFGFDQDFQINQPISWHLALSDGSSWQDIRDLVPGLSYAGHDRPFFVYRPTIEKILHGSCRKPHFPGADGLVIADEWLANTGPQSWPSALLMSGDQIYADDVAGPMLAAIHRLIARLGLPDEDLSDLGAAVPSGENALWQDQHSLYGREAWLPEDLSSTDLWHILFGGVRKPVFTSDHAHNHLFSLAEFLAMYLLVWSPAGWQDLDLSPPPQIQDKFRPLYDQELPVIEKFVDGLHQTRRVMAHLPVAMIFDDHDVTDDWNLTRDWEDVAYNHPLSRRMIGNALTSYLLNQGWGNAPDAFPTDMLDALQNGIAEPDSAAHEDFLDTLFRFEGWDYRWEFSPGIVVLDTRTRRWRSEGNGNRPSGLLDWEAVTDLQRALRGRDAVILVSAAPVFGVKLIENVQRFFSLIGKPLMVDAEYWMAHSGTANAMLNIFRHRKTPQHFTILSGDVHYSFVYDVTLRGRRSAAQIWQICSSGIKNEFPHKLLTIFDRLNRWLYHPRSPLNWFTSRRRMRVTPRKPVGSADGRRLLSASGIGLVVFDADGRPIDIRQLLPNSTDSRFERREQESIEE